MVKEVKEPVIVRLQSSALDEKNGEIIAHGWLDIDALNNLRVGDYQREILETTGGRKSALRKAVEAGERLPDIMLGMRGQSYTPRGSAMLLENDVYIVDGLQRVSALRKFAADNPERASEVRIGAEVRFATNRDSEEELFTILNVQRKAMSASVILRNKRQHSNGVATLYGLTMTDKSFPMIGKVCWDQQMHRGELLTALSFAKSVVTLHRHVTFGGRNLTVAGKLPGFLDNMSGIIGLQTFRNNVVAFYEAIDDIWGLRGIKYTDRAIHTRSTFLIQLAAVFSDHEDFWDGKKLVIDAGQKAKLKSFPIDDPTIIRLASSGANAGILLYRHFIDHMNKGKQTSRYLTTRRIEDYRARGSAKNNNKKDAA